MDLNITNFDVTTKEIKLNQTAELPIDIDISLSDYEQDIKKILKCTMNSYVSSKQITGNSLIVEGMAYLTLIYCDVNGDLCSTEKQIPFKKNFEASLMLDGGEAEVFSISSVNSSMLLTERKVAVKGIVRLDATVIVSEKNSIISDLDNDCFEQLKISTKASTEIGKTSKTFIIDEEFELPPNCPSISKIIKTNYCISSVTTKVISNKIIVKGQLNIKVFYRTNENGIHCYKNIVPFNQIIEINGITEDCKCDINTELLSVNLTTRTASNGECKTLMLVAKIEVLAEAICEDELPMIRDLYCKRHEASVVKKEICVNKIVHNSNEVFNCKKTLSLPQNEISDILALWCESGKCITRFSDSNLNLSGTVTVCTLFKDNENEIGYFEKVIDFDYVIEIGPKTTNPKCKCSAEIINESYGLTPSGDIDLNLELQISATIFDMVKMEVITEITADENKPISSSTSLVAYFAEAGENVWEISKNFLADRENFLAINDIKEDTIKTSRMLLIPRF